MLVALLGAAAYAPAHRVMPAHAVVSSTTRAAVSMADDSLLQSMSDSFYANKRARLESELAARLSELEEYEARERALIDMSGPAIGAAGGSAGLLAELEAEKAKTAALEAALAQQKLDSEVALQKVAAYWYARSPQHPALRGAFTRERATSLSSQAASRRSERLERILRVLRVAAGLPSSTKPNWRRHSPQLGSQPWQPQPQPRPPRTSCQRQKNSSILTSAFASSVSAC